METKNIRLPYIDNAKAILITIAINIGVVFLFHYPGGVSFSDVIYDSLICAFITVVIDMCVVYFAIKKMRTAGKMPSVVPVSRFMQKLPRNPLVLGLIFAVVFAAITAAVNGLIITFFGLQNMAFAPWVVYKLIYATTLSIFIAECCIFRYVQPDCAIIPAAAAETANSVTVKNPMQKISVLKEMAGGVAGNIVMNFIMGSIMGGIKAQADGSVVISPTTVAGIAITGLIFGLIVGILVTRGVLTAMNTVILGLGPQMPEDAEKKKRFTWMPKKRAALIFLVTICVMIVSAIILPSIMVLFDKPFLNFYQFVVLISVYAALLSKPLSYIITRRCMQADYIQYTLLRQTR